jgi:dTDP-glucose pyrophosphorylase
MMNRIIAVEDSLWRQALLSPDSTIKQALDNLDLVEIQIVLIVDSSGALIGTITDGDIRRALLRGLNLNSSIDTVIHHDALVVSPHMSREIVMHIMLTNKIRQLPIVEENRRVVGLHLWDKIAAPPLRTDLMVIMAGGQGTRLRPYTEHCPKPLLPISGKPILEHIIERARAEGFRHFVLAIHYLGQMIEDYFGNGDRLQVRIDYLREPSPLGTAGALGLLNPRPNAPFIVTNGDVLTDIHYNELLEFHIRHDATATMAVRGHEWQHPFGVVQTQGVEIVGFEEKPISRTHINAGVYVLDPDALDVLRINEHCDMPLLFELLYSNGKRTVAYPMHEPWLDVGRVEDLATANDNLAKESTGKI